MRPSIRLAFVLIPGLALIAMIAPAQLVVNEVDYDQAGTDGAEFVELKNVSAFGEDLDVYSVQLVNGTGGGASIYQEYFLPAVTLAAGDYYVICGDAANVANCDLDVSPDSNLIQNGAPDAVAVAFKGFVIDTVSYEGDSGAPYTEGSGVGLEDDSSVADSGIARCADGADTDMNNVDFIFTGITPGETNDCPPGPAFTLAVSGLCPGDVTVDLTDGTANGTAAILLGSGVGSDLLPGGPCVGAQSGLTLIGLGPVVVLDANGGFSATVTLPSSACGTTLQGLDSSNCSFSNTDVVP